MNLKPHLQLISEGTPQSTRLITSAGTELHGVTSAQVSITPDAPVVIDVRLAIIQLDIEGHAQFRMTHPETGEIMKVARIEFEGGRSWEAPR